MGLTVGIIGAATAVAGGTYTAVNANQNRIAAQKVADKQTDAQNQALDAANKQQKDAQTQLDLNATRNNARAMQQANSMTNQGRGATILTSPLGVTTGANTTDKKLIGS